MLELQRYIVKEQVAMLKVTDTYDIFDAESGKHLGVAKEVIGGFAAVMRWIIAKSMMPTRVEVRELPDQSLVFVMTRGWTFMRQRLEVRDAQNELIGYFVSKLFSIAGAFTVYTADDKLFAEVRGKNMLGFEYEFRTADQQLLGNVDKKFESVMKELFTSADTYQVTISEELREQPVAKMLLLAAALAIDIVFKESN